ncbi:hypothetical protein ACW5DW_11935 [Luteimonas sp. A482]
MSALLLKWSIARICDVSARVIAAGTSPPAKQGINALQWEQI